jgi:hypothetical protein
MWVDSAVATMGADEGTLHRASQPSIIMHPDSAMPTGPIRTHRTRITIVARREPLMTHEYPAMTLCSQVLGRGTSLGGSYDEETTCTAHR